MPAPNTPYSDRSNHTTCAPPCTAGSTSIPPSPSATSPAGPFPSSTKVEPSKRSSERQPTPTNCTAQHEDAETNQYSASPRPCSDNRNLFGEEAMAGRQGKLRIESLADLKRTLADSSGSEFGLLVRGERKVEMEIDAKVISELEKLLHRAVGSRG